MKRMLEKGKHNKKAVCCVLAMAVFVASVFSVATSGFGQTITYDISPTRLGTSDTYYSFEADTKTLIISGEGDTPDFRNNAASIPWYEWTADTVERVVVEKGITKIGNYMFYQIAASEYKLAPGIKTIGRYAFSFNNKMTEIDIPYGVETIMLNAFASNYRLERLTLPDSLVEIGTRAFYNCIALDNVVIPASVKTISTYAFQQCSSLTDVRFRSLTQFTDVGNYAFAACSSLKTIAVPLNTTMGIKTFGYSGNTSTASKYSDLLMKVFENSDGYNYATVNNIPYEFIDRIPIECGVEYANKYTEENLSVVYHYVFTPQTTEKFNLYSVGNCDLVGKLYKDGVLIGENDDIAQDNRNFCISKELEAGETYDLYVNSVKMEGDYSVYVFPDDITGLEVIEGSIDSDVTESKVVDRHRIFSFDEEKFSKFVLKVDFSNGLEEYMPYNSYIAGYYVVSGDDQIQNPYICGEGEASLSLKNNKASYPITISHSYESKIVEPTVDDNGYTLHTCVICGDSYTDTEVEPDSYIVTGNCIMAENPYGKHDENIPYSHATIRIGTREYKVNDDGTWKIRTFSDCYAVFQNEYGSNFTIHVDVEKNGSYNYGSVILDGYDHNLDGYVNAKDYVIYRKKLYDQLGEDYWRYGAEYLIKH